MPRPGTSVVHPRMLGAVRRVAEEAMRDVCRIERRTAARGAFNSANGTHAASAPTVVYDGPCRVQSSPTSDRVVDVGDQPVTYRRYSVGLPMSAPQPRVDDVVVITSSADPHFAGRRMRVMDVIFGADQAQRQLVCEDDQG